MNEGDLFVCLSNNNKARNAVVVTTLLFAVLRADHYPHTEPHVVPHYGTVRTVRYRYRTAAPKSVRYRYGRKSHLLLPG